MFIFRRDLRVDDNRGLAAAVRASERVIPCFVFDDRQQHSRNGYFGAAAFQVLLESLEDLEIQLAARNGALARFRGDPSAIVERVARAHEVDAVFVSRDYTPFSAIRDGEIASACGRVGIAFRAIDDALLTAPEDVLTKDGTPFVTFTPFYDAATKLDVGAPASLGKVTFFRGRIEGSLTKAVYREVLPERRRGLAIRGGRTEGLALLGNVTPDEPTRLSAHHKHGTISARETFRGLFRDLPEKRAEELVRQLYWRDFFTHLAFHHPHVFRGALDRRMDRVEWRPDEAGFRAWCEGRTGFPIVDAAMRELAETGTIDNRHRMVVASFLTKSLLVDWRRGERHFAQHLVDYDPCVNNGNWQWTASVGSDPRPIRVFNPWRQQRRFDPDAEHVKRWVPELAALDARQIHALESERPDALDYPEPIVDHPAAAERAKNAYARARR